MLPYELSRPWTPGTILTAGDAASAYSYFNRTHDPKSPTWGDGDDQVAGYYELGADKWQAFDNRENQLWEEEFPSALHCSAWLNPLLNLEAEEIRELSGEQIQALEHDQFTVVLSGLQIKDNRTSGPVTAFTTTVLASGRAQAIDLAYEAYHQTHNRRPYPPDYLTVCAVFAGYLHPLAN